MLGTIAIILVFGGLIFFHELGHFLAARSFGMGVQTFSLGFGPVIFSFTPGKTKYQLAAVPLGGYVALVGETDEADLPENFTPEESFSLRPAWQRFIVIATGPIFNLILAWFLCWALLASNGKQELLPVVGDLTEVSSAKQAGISSGDIIHSINGSKVESWTDIPPLIADSKGTPMQIEVDRSGTTHSFTVKPDQISRENLFGEEKDVWVIGITPAGDLKTIHYSFLSAAKPAINDAARMIELTWRVLVGLVKGKVSADNIGGPIGIGKVIYDQAESGMSHVLFIAALISVNLGILNLLPIPILDGGHLLFLSFEMISRKQVPIYIKEKAAMAGLFLLLGLMLFATYNDILRFFQ